MKDLFPAYYRLSDAELSERMKDCIFVLDTNVLFHLYRYSEASRKQLLDIMNRLATQLWMPHQIAYEFQKGRLERIVEREVQIEQLLAILEPLQTTRTVVYKNPLIERHRRDSYSNLDSLLKQYDRALAKLFRDLRKVAESLPDWDANDPIRESIEAIYSDERIGKPLDEARLKTAYDEGSERYKRKMPPGYKDGSTKEGNEKYGDYIIWLQLIDFAKETNKPIVLVTDDQKEDWWLIINGRRKGARVELIEEMQQKGGAYFHLYNVQSFLRWAQKLLELNANDVEQVIEEARQFEVEEKKEIDYHQQSLAMSPTNDFDVVVATDGGTRFFVEPTFSENFKLMRSPGSQEMKATKWATLEAYREYVAKNTLTKEDQELLVHLLLNNERPLTLRQALAITTQKADDDLLEFLNTRRLMGKQENDQATDPQDSPSDKKINADEQMQHKVQNIPKKK